MTGRKALLVGSLPFKNEEEAMDLSLSMLGEHLMSVPDGEIGERSKKYPSGSRSAWVCLQANEFAEDKENWEVINDAIMNKDGFPAGYDKIYTLRTKHSPEELSKHINLHYHEFFAQSYPIFQRLRKAYGHEHVKFQVGIPTGLTLSIFVLEPSIAIDYYKAFHQRIIDEVNIVLEQAADDVIVQLELPIEMGMVYQNPPQDDLALESIMGLVKNFKHSTQVGIHLCCGDLNNESWTHPETLKPLVEFVHRVVEEWPENQKLAYVHIPLAEGDVPPTLSKDFYSPLGNLQLPAHTELIAGFVHEKRSIDELRIIQSHVENIYGYPVGVATSCGMGRRSRKTGEQLFSLMQQLVKN